ncbi:bifunctional nicotinamidase/pyrazinamidase [Algoriphagus aestuariicola]|jgi:nicotinamidase/pyrazinamidase|uniref:nicotinamidase n=1 Tax=Algoriphagus aestuariicola TaxID=1852016 RepID=A0ABS3BNL6_9BACT|nr:bifunctional nicotinamidase/pyrazinamidase [Algoriphagus aestuariicola]MBN7800882.1 bifunctional nicotinamidase/pyrazinamidase [Algoriphagus aestuariicola]
MVKIDKDDVLLIVDVQNDFLPGGALAVAEGDQIIPVINKLQGKFSLVVATQDFHPASHGSFAANHVGKNPGDFIELAGLTQILWPVHCVQGTFGGDFHADLARDRWTAVFQKGMNPEVDSYSGFFDNARKGDTGLGEFLTTIGAKRVFVCGLALDYCVKFTAQDSKELGFETFLISDATRAVNLRPTDGAKAIDEMKAQGINVISSQDL